MKIAVVVAEGIKQVMLTPESDEERAALKLMTPTNNDGMKVEYHWGTLYDRTPPSAGYTINPCRAGYLRAYESPDSLMLVVRRPPSAPAGETP